MCAFSLNSTSASFFKENNTRAILRALGIVVFVYILVAITSQSALAAVFNSASGDVDALINAINTANANNEDDSINLEAGEYLLTQTIGDSSSDLLPEITSTIRIAGAGAENTIIKRGADEDTSMLSVTNSGTLTLDDITIDGNIVLFSMTGPAIGNSGSLTMNDSNVIRNAAVFCGGIANAGILSLVRTTVRGNSA